ncbi:N-acylhomoserine lactone synthetase-related protein [Geotalea daltonii FRC-32]|uniref:N-acylhomoserine lactone synthetase-related protein n=1 Tax=Geotalea daltonii (strain DSM 22248 / JCM 15807 / FRC-32) TaxID=316067 RepID=B9LZZ0_GEODF|nr:acyl-homoserine-lactone synthase [Geotalea daltonii]ACM20770.1 N-acylhomoserine lactone synthetase-related protein [Geotalea daltonii FRC-32]
MIAISKHVATPAANGLKSDVFIREGGLYVTNIVAKEDIFKAHSLRYRVFCDELGWAPQNFCKLDIDNYDDGAVFFGVFDVNNDLKAFLRIVTSDHPFMIENEFPFLVKAGSTISKRDDVVEVSRLCVDADARSETFSGNFGVHTASLLLYKGVYHWCLKNRINYLYLVVDYKVFRLLNVKGFPCRLIGDPKVMPDGVVAVAAMLNWREFEELNLVGTKNLKSWFSQYQLPPPTVQLPQREFCSQH